MDWYVDSRAGNDANDGRGPGTAFKTILHASQAVKSGDTLLIAPGSYEQDLPQKVASLRALNVVVLVLGGH